MEFKTGDMVKCCGGMDGMILEIRPKTVLVAIPLHSMPGIKYAIGSWWKEYEGELVWGQGHYYDIVKNSIGNLGDVWECFEEVDKRYGK